MVSIDRSPAFFVGIALSAFLLPFSAFAQTGSGGTFEDVLMRMNEALADHPATNQASLMPPPEKLSAWMSEHETLRSRLVENRTNCARDIRESNRDTKWPTLRRCQRTRLSQEMTLLQKKRQQISEIPGTNAEVQKVTLAKADALIDALRALLNALDTGLFESSRDLDAALLRLLNQYRLPWLTALEHWRIDRSLLWLSLIVKRIADLQPEERSAQLTEQLREALLCLEKDHGFLLAAEAEKEHEKINILMSQRQSGLLQCLGLLRAAVRLHRADEEKMNGKAGSGTTLVPSEIFRKYI